MSSIHGHHLINLHSSPGVAVGMSHVLSLALSVDVILAPSISASMAQHGPVDTQVAVASIFIPSVVGVLPEHPITVGIV